MKGTFYPCIWGKIRKGLEAISYFHVGFSMNVGLRRGVLDFSL